ncbi:MAG: hypothetical protein D6698_10130 [Gammaproteobacteria bacterium]|nr:MAG: hypothetical protein D6698_10130 [Gammaproteobacteria bacterium]
MGRISKLEAVNRMLRAASERPVSTLEADGVNDTDLAVSVLEEVLVEVLTNGLNCNTEKMTLTPTSDGQIIVSDNFLSIDTTGKDRHKNVVVRGDTLYDLDNQTDEFEDSLEVIVRRYIDYEDLPTGIQIFIRDIAARRYQQESLGDRSIDAQLAEIELRSRALGHSEDARSKDRHYLDGGSYVSRRIIYRKPGMWRWS